MATNATLGLLLTPEMWNNAFASTLDLSQTGPQTMVGPLTVPQLTAPISLTTQDLTATGNVVLSGTSAVQIPTGTTLQRPNRPVAGSIRFNTDSSSYEVYLPSGSWAAVVTTGTQQTPISPPVSQGAVSFGQASSTSIPVGWAAPSGGTPPFSYTVQYRPTGTTNFETWASNLTTTTTTISGLLPATRYDFFVQAFNGAGSVSSPVSSSNTLGYLSGGPTGVTAQNPTATTVYLAWTAVSSTLPVNYSVNYAIASAATWSNFGSTDQTDITVTGLLPNSLYNFQIVAQTTGGAYESTIIQASTTAVSTVAPNAPGTPTLSGLTENSVQVSWTAPTQGTPPFSYTVELQISGSSWIDTFYPATTALTMLANELTSGQTFNIRVRALNSAGQANSVAVAVTPPAQSSSIGNVAGYQLSGYTGNGPFLFGPQTAMIYTGSSIDLIGCGVSDPAAASMPGTVSLTVACGGGTVTMTDAAGKQMQSSGTKTMGPLPLTFASCQAALATLSYSAPSTPVSDTVVITVADQLGTSATISVSVSVQQSTGPTTPSPTPSPPPPPPPVSGGGGGTPPPGLRTSTGQPTDATGTIAGRMMVALAGLGVGISPESSSYGGYSAVNAAATENAINYIGAGYLGAVRVNVGGNFNSPSEQQFLAQVAANCGNLFYLMALDVNSLSTFSWQQVLNNVVSFAQNFGLVEGIGGVVNAGGVYGTSASNINAAASFMANVSSAAQSVGVNSIGYTTWYNSGTPSRAPNDFIDVGYAYSFPAYSPNRVVPSGATPVHSFSQTEALTLSENLGSSPLYAQTEFGWNSFPDTAAPISTFNYCSQTAQAAYLLTYLFNNYKFSQLSGLTTFTGGLCIWADLFNNASSLYGSAMGLFPTPGGSPTLAAQALRNTFQLLYDASPSSATFAPGMLNYTVTYANGAPNAPSPYMGAQSLLFQRSDGTFVIVLWNEQQLNNTSTNAPIWVASRQATISFSGVMSQLSYYDPLAPSTGSTPSPLYQASYEASISVPVPPYPVYILVSHP